jgi:hypothetical protein
MFQSCEYRDYSYLIRDTDFRVETAVRRQITVPLEIVDAVVAVYREYKLPVAPNLAKALVYMAKDWSCSVQELIRLIETAHRIGPDLFSPYKNDVMKYLVLLP